MQRLAMAFAVIAMTVFAAGCPDSGSPAGENGSETTTTTTENDHGHSHDGDANAHADDPAADEHEGHDHSAVDHTPPHGGHLIELGRDHEYHAELLDDHESHSVTIFIMDADMKPLVINQASVGLTLTAAETTATFDIVAGSPGGASEFSSNERKLLDMLMSEAVTGKLRVTINDAPFTGSFAHAGHEHAGESEDAHAGHNHD